MDHACLLLATSHVVLHRVAAIFLEFYHFKPKKSKNSLKCFALMEQHEIKVGKSALEL